MITFEVRYGEGGSRVIGVPEDMNLSLMEVLRASEYPIAATCGGIALCATCYVEVLEGHESLEAATDAELDMLDTLPATTAQSRLACQVRISARLQNAVVQLKLPE